METLGQERRNGSFFYKAHGRVVHWKGWLVVAGTCRASCLRSSQVCRPFASSTVQQIRLSWHFSLWLFEFILI